MVLNPQRQIDYLEQETQVSEILDDYNILKSPYKINLWNYKDLTSGKTPTYEYDNWIQSSTLNSIKGLHGSETDLIHVTFPQIKALEHKLVTRIEIVTDIEVDTDDDLNSDTYPRLNSVGIGYNKTYTNVQVDNGGEIGWKQTSDGEYKPIPITSNKSHITFSNNENNLIWGYNSLELTKILQSGGFTIEFNVDISNSTHTITFKNTYLNIYFENYFNNESKAVENRLMSLGYNLGNDNIDYDLYVNEEGELIYEYNTMNSPIMYIEDGYLIIEGDAPTFELEDLTGLLVSGYAEDCTLYVAVTNQTQSQGYRVDDDLLVTVAVLDTDNNRVVNRTINLTVSKYNTSTSEYDALSTYTTNITTTSDGYAYHHLSFNEKGSYNITILNTEDDYYNRSSITKNINVEV